MGCTDWEEDIALFHDGELPDPRRRRVEEHLRGCEACRAELQALRRIDGLVRQAAPASAPAGGGGPTRALQTALAAGRARSTLFARLRIASVAAAVLAALAAGYLLAPKAPQAPPSLAERVTRLLAEYAETGSDARRGEIARELEAQGEQALPYLVHALDSPSLSHQVAATRVLGRFRDKKVAELLVDYAANRGMLGRPASPPPDDLLSGPISADAALALLDADGVPPTIVSDALRSVYDRARLRPRDVEALRKAGFARLPAVAPEAQVLLDALRERLRGGDLKRKLASIEAARALRARPLVPDLIACLGSEGAREAAWSALREITGQDLPLNAGAWERWQKESLKDAEPM